MTQERFLQILKDPALLADISYEELKTLALAYPATHNFRTLLALKAQQTGHPEFNKQLAAAAAYSLDRSRLFHLMAPEQLAPQAVIKSEEVLQLKPIADIRKALDNKVPLEKLAESATLKAKEADRPEPPASTPAPVQQINDLPATSQIPALPVVQSVAPALEAVPEDGGHWIQISRLPVLQPLEDKQNTDASDDLNEDVSDQPEAVSIAPKTSVQDTAASESTEKQGFSAQELAERSVYLREEVASETLARLMAKQGFKDKAVAMYEKLRLLFPEKSDYFAAEIAKLKK